MVTGYPLLTAINCHALHRAQGIVVLRSEFYEALQDLGIEAVPLPSDRLIEAGILEQALRDAGVTVTIIQEKTGATIWGGRRPYG